MTPTLPPTDNRMLWVRSMESVEQVPIQSRYSESYELVSECEIRRRLWYRDGLIACSCLGASTYIDGIFTYELKFLLPNYQEERDENDEIISRASSEGYFSRSRADEIISLLSLFLHTRFFEVQRRIGEHTANSIGVQHGKKFVYLPCRDSNQKKSHVFHSKDKDLWPVAEMLEKVRRLNPDVHQKFYFAISNYADALRLIGFEDEIAYIKLVAAISALASTNTPGQDRREFKGFIQKYGIGYFTARPGVEWSWVNKDNLDRYLDTIYNARSRYLHAGIPMWICEEQDYFSEVGRGYDLGFAIGRISDHRHWDEFDRVPSTLFFEGLVRECLINYLNEFSVTRQEAA